MHLNGKGKWASAAICIAVISLVLCLMILTAGCAEFSMVSPKANASGPDTTQVSLVSTSPPASQRVIAFTAASMKGVSAVLGPAFGEANPGYSVTFNLDGTQALKQQLESGAQADVFISASNTYTNALKSKGYFVNETVKPFSSNYIVVILPAGNPGNITALSDLGIGGKSIAMGANEVPVGNNTRIVIDKLAANTLSAAWKDALYANVKTYETAEPAIVTKVSLGEVDAGFVYESSYKAAKPGTLTAITIPEESNALQTYTIGILASSTNKDAAKKFEDFVLSPQGQRILSDFGFRSL
jgi:molybdate transport system substrate-binding protein